MTCDIISIEGTITFEGLSSQVKLTLSIIEHSYA
jgi:hypothetical protein